MTTTINNAAIAIATLCNARIPNSEIINIASGHKNYDGTSHDISWAYAEALCDALFDAGWDIDHMGGDDIRDDCDDNWSCAVSAIHSLLTGYSSFGIAPGFYIHANRFEILFFDAEYDCTKSLWREMTPAERKSFDLAKEPRTDAVCLPHSDGDLAFTRMDDIAYELYDAILNAHPNLHIDIEADIIPALTDLALNLRLKRTSAGAFRAMLENIIDKIIAEKE